MLSKNENQILTSALQPKQDPTHAPRTLLDGLVMCSRTSALKTLQTSVSRLFLGDVTEDTCNLAKEMSRTWHDLQF